MRDGRFSHTFIILDQKLIKTCCSNPSLFWVTVFLNLNARFGEGFLVKGFSDVEIFNKIYLPLVTQVIFTPEACYRSCVLQNLFKFVQIMIEKKAGRSVQCCDNLLSPDDRGEATQKCQLLLFINFILQNLQEN